MDVSVDVRQLLIRHDLGPIRRHVAGRWVSDKGDEDCDRQFNLCQPLSRRSSLPHSAMALVTAISHKQTFAICSVAALGLGDGHRDAVLEQARVSS